VKNAQVLACPDDNVKLTPANFWPGVWTNESVATIEGYGFNSALWNAPISYGMTETMMCGEINDNWGSANPADNKSMPITLAYLQKPAQTFALGDTFAMTAGTIYDGNGTWGYLPDPTNPLDPYHKCIMYKVAYANQGNSSLLSPYGNEDPCNETLPAWDTLTRHSLGSNIVYCDGHAKWSRNSAITNDLYLGTQAQ
jgi:prepilin-type processing-associated H-X9-DG protein